MIAVPLSPIPSQSFQIVLNGQDCEIEVLTRGEHIFLNLTVDGELIQAGAICVNLVPIVQIPTSKFIGNLVFIDTLGEKNPTYTGLGDRFQLVYLLDEEMES